MSYSSYMAPYKALLEELKRLEALEGNNAVLTGEQLRMARESVATFIGDNEHSRAASIRSIFEQLFAERAARSLAAGEPARDLACQTWRQAKEAWEAKPQDC